MTSGTALSAPAGSPSVDAPAPAAHVVLAATVRSIERLSPSFVRIAFGGEGFDQVGPEGAALDQRIKLVIPGPGRSFPLHLIRPDSWYAAWLALPEGERGQVRTYTVRSVLGEGADRRVIVDFVLHEPSGPAGAFAASAKVGDVVGMLAPRRGREDEFGGIEFRPGAARRLWFTADETAVPALASILESLPPDADGWAVAEVPNAADVRHLDTPAGLRVDWLVRASQPRGRATIEAVRARCGLHVQVVDPALATPVERPEEEVWETAIFSSSGEVVGDRAAARGVGPDETYAWVAGDSDTVKAIRRILVGEVGMARHHVAFMGYWKVGTAQA
ncbi:MAG TPA: siderophore-interacting protein [Intrasporangium sp.]|nr:siderophore-interacting protein [Intrasporangium sp.]